MNKSRRCFARGLVSASVLGQFLGAAFMLGASAVRAIGAPEVSVKEVQLQGVDREQVSLLVVLKMDNSNPVPIPLSTIQFLARVEDRELAKGETTESLRLPALGSADASFKVLIPLRAIPGALDRGLVALFGHAGEFHIRLGAFDQGIDRRHRGMALVEAAQGALRFLEESRCLVKAGEVLISLAGVHDFSFGLNQGGFLFQLVAFC